MAAAGQVADRSTEVRNPEQGNAIPGMPDVVTRFARARATCGSPTDVKEQAWSYGVSVTSVASGLRR